MPFPDPGRGANSGPSAGASTSLTAASDMRSDPRPQPHCKRGRAVPPGPLTRLGSPRGSALSAPSTAERQSQRPGTAAPPHPGVGQGGRRERAGERVRDAAPGSEGSSVRSEGRSAASAAVAVVREASGSPHGGVPPFSSCGFRLVSPRRWALLGGIPLGSVGDFPSWRESGRVEEAKLFHMAGEGGERGGRFI